jgi:Leucine-rich repeat (LRR) protein
MKKLITALAIIILLTSCGSPEIADVLATSATATSATFEMSTAAETTITPKTTTTAVLTITNSPVTTSATIQIHEPMELLILDDIINDVEARNEHFEIIDSEIINLNNDSFDDVIVLSLQFMEANFSYYAYDGNAYTLLNDVKILRAFNFNKQVFEFGSIPGEIENLIIKDFEYDGEMIKTIIFSRHFYFEQLNYIAELYVDNNNEFSIRAIMAFGIEIEDAATGQFFKPVYYRNIEGEQTAITASEFYPLASDYLSDEEIAFPTDPAFAFEPDSVNIRGYKIPLDCEEFAVMNHDMPSHPIILNTIEITDKITDEDITAISQLKNLRTLGLINVGLTDISFLESNKNLERIFLDYNEITDIGLFDEFSHLNLLSLSYNPIKDISSLSKLTSLKYLDLSFTDIDSISNLPENLFSLSVQKTNVDSFDKISTLEKLQILNICDNNIADISFIKNLSKLEYFYASNNDITDISPLKNKDLKIIHMTHNNIHDFAILAGLNSPTELWLDFTDEDIAYFISLYPDCIILNYR